jgi:hypothetical protein
MEKHLEFIQGVINRHNSNSFTLKGWSITLISALFALSGTISEPNVVLIGLIPIFLFWGLDAFYLANERCFVDLYNAVAEKSYSIPKVKCFKPHNMNGLKDLETGMISSFNMNFKIFKIWKNNTWFYVLWSKTLFWFYLPQVIITVIIFIFFLNINQHKVKSLDVNATLKSNGLSIDLKKNSPLPIIDTLEKK